MSLVIYGIRHHGPGCARSVVEALDANPPAAVLVEGPPDADDLLPHAALAGLQPPVALLIHRADTPGEAVFYPFAEFSPEWQAIRWALARGVPVRFMDLPWLHRFALRDTPPGHPGPSDPTPPPPTNDAAVGEETLSAYRRDPLSVLAAADGYSDSERWWNDRVEERGAPAGMFTAILEAMTAVRTELALPETLEERRREAWMRRVIRETQREFLGDVAVVCGAWHAPALAYPPKVAADNELLKGLPKAKVGATWVPWTYQRLCSASGYGAGIEAPGWYEHIWNHRRDPLLSARWLGKVARLLRVHDLSASTAQVIDGVRLAEHLAAFRGRAIPGLAELDEAGLAVYCHGDATPLRLIHRELTVGTRLGEVPPGLAQVPLQDDIEATQRRLRLKPSAAQTVVELDLREATGLERSRFLHRLRIIDITWGHAEEVTGKGTFKEAWRLEWKPEFALTIIDGARLGNTLELAAVGALATKATQADLPTLGGLLEQALLAALPDATHALLTRIANEAAQSDDVLRLVNAVPALARLARYGDVRQADTTEVIRIIDGFCARVHVGVKAAVTGLDEDAAETWHRALKGYQAALVLVESAHLATWREQLTGILASTVSHPLIGGTAARLLFETGHLTSAAAGTALGVALSVGQEPAHAAAWLEGFLRDQGAVLVHDPSLLPLLETWVAALSDETFVAVLPLVRRTFATFSSPERARIATRLGSPAAPNATPTGGASLDPEKITALLPILGSLLGHTFPTATPTPANAPAAP